MTRGFASTEQMAAWRRDGSPYCEHPKFVRDRDPFGGRDQTDWYCTTCGAVRIFENGEIPPPSGVKPS